MASRSHKLYHETSFDTKRHLDTYLSSEGGKVFEEDFLKAPMEKLHNSFISGRIQGDILADLSMGSFIHHLYSACGFCKEIIILRFSDRCVMELNKWRHDRTGAYDWSHTAAIANQLAGESDHQEEKDLKLKKTITHVVRCDLNNENLIDPLVVPPADCLITAVLLESISKDKEEYIRNLKKFIKFLKPTGHLILFGVINASYYTVGEERFHTFSCDENFVQEALIREGFCIDQCEVLKRKANSPLLDYKGIVYIIAHRE